MNKLEMIRDRYSKNELTKQEYCEEVFEATKSLSEISQYIKNTIITNILIRPNEVEFTLDIFGKPVILTCPSDPGGIASFIFAENVRDEDEMRMFLKLINDNDCVFDIGANIGFISIIPQIFYKGLKVYSFEPVPGTYSQLVKNHQLNRLSTERLFNNGFSDTKSNNEFYVNTKFLGSSGLRNLQYSDPTDIKKTTCRMERLDDFAAEHAVENIDFIKCDVEGAELLVIKGGLKSIRRFKPIIQLEMLRKWAAKFNYHPNDIIDLLEKEGYSCYVLDGQNLKLFKRVDDNTVEKLYYFVHEEKHGIIDKINSEN